MKKTIPLYIGLTTGFCGSFTSFSSFMRDAFLALSNSSTTFSSSSDSFVVPDPARSGGYSFEAVLAVLISEIAISLFGLYIGGHLALALDSVCPTIPHALYSKVLDRLAVLVGLGCWIGAIIMSILPPDRPGGPASGPSSTWSTETWRGKILFAIVLAPAGCILRFYVSMLLNSRVASFPLGTFSVNVFGTALEAAFYALQHVGLPVGVGGGRLGCQILQGAMDGFCGCLTTVSTWVAELSALSHRHAWAYGLSTVVAGVAAMVVVLGSVKWDLGLLGTACGMP